MKHDRIHNNENLRSSGLTKNLFYRFGRTELLLLLLLFTAGIFVDYWFNHHPLPWQSSNSHAQVFTSVPLNA
ncbi:hypothetical protein [Fischerella sp. JS2]|uniref:hypothetical protein n=1 Tax=Fischerella sp. JS2 TaxID=2597771 RepID=UPI0028E6B4FF|nr:hypothetical protein [Fischerella sp. JS2]